MRCVAAQPYHNIIHFIFLIPPIAERQERLLYKLNVCPVMAFSSVLSHYLNYCLWKRNF